MADSRPHRDQQQETPGSASPESRSDPRANGHSQADLDLEAGRAHLRKLEAAARLAEAKAKTAEHQSNQVRHYAAAEPERQATTQWERTTRLKLEVTKTWMVFGVTLIFLAIQVAALIINPWLSPASFLIAFLGLLVNHLLAKEKQEQQPEEQSSDP